MEGTELVLTIRATGEVRNAQGQLLDADRNVIPEGDPGAPVVFEHQVHISQEEAERLGLIEGKSS